MNSPYRPRSGHADDLGGAETIETVDEGDADVESSSLATVVPRGNVFTESFQVSHPRLELLRARFTVHRFRNALLK